MIFNGCIICVYSCPQCFENSLFVYRWAYVSELIMSASMQKNTNGYSKQSEMSSCFENIVSEELPLYVISTIS